MAFKDSDKIEEICNVLYGHEKRIEKSEKSIDNIYKVLNSHQEAINIIFNDLDELKVKVNQIMNRVNDIDDKVNKGIIKSKRERIGTYINEMNEEQMYEFATFILELRAGNKPYDLDVLIKGAKMILKSS